MFIFIVFLVSRGLLGCSWVREAFGRVRDAFGGFREALGAFWEASGRSRGLLGGMGAALGDPQVRVECCSVGARTTII